MAEITIAEDGFYNIGGNVAFNINKGGHIYTNITVNDVTVFADNQIPIDIGNSIIGFSLNGMYAMEDIIKVYASHNCGINIDVGADIVSY